MICIDLRYYHRYIRCPAVCTIVRYNRCLCLRIRFFNCFDLVFRHIHCTEYKINCRCYMLYIIYIQDYQLLNCFRHRCIHFPTVTYCFFICLTCGTRACCYCYNFKPWMILKQRNKSLSYHTCCSKDTYS